jgi:hypothetical protein
MLLRRRRTVEGSARAGGEVLGAKMVVMIAVEPTPRTIISVLWELSIADGGVADAQDNSGLRLARLATGGA